MHRVAPRIAALALALAACHTWGRITPQEITAGSGNAHSRVWVTRADNSTVQLGDPQLIGDTLTGMVNGEPDRIALSDVVTIRARRSAVGRTIMLGVAATGVAFAGLYYMEHRPDVGNTQICSNGILDMGVMPGSQYFPCCMVTMTAPC